MSDHTGHRTKVGLILPSRNTVTEPLFYSIAPNEVAFFSSRVLFTGTRPEDVKGMEQQKDRAVRELASAKVNLIVDCCTGSGVLRELEGKGEDAFCARVEENTGIPAITTLSAILEALAVLHLHELVITTPSREIFDTLEKEFFEKQGFHVVNIRGLGLSDGCAFAEVSPRHIYDFSKSAWDPRADGLLISCMNFKAVPAIEALETDLKVPVVSSNSATLWKILRMTKLREPITHCGKLLSEFM